MTNSSESDYLHHAVQVPFMVMWASLTGSLLAVASICNAWNLVCLLFFVYSGRCTTAHVLSGVLFLNDFFSSTVFYPGIVINILRGNQGLWQERWFCQLISFGGTLSAVCSSMSNTQIAVFRVYMAYMRHCPAYKIRAQKKHVAAILVAFTYFLSALVPSISYLPAGTREIDPPYGFCGLEPHKQDGAIKLVRLISWVFAPTTVTSVCYWMVYRMLRETKRDKQARSSARLRRLFIRIRWMVLLKILAHYPVALFYLIRADESPKPTINLIVLTLHFCSPLFNAVIHKQ